MSRLFRAAFSLLLLLAFVSFLGCEGDQGPQGPSGPKGPKGSDGTDASIDPPGDMVFGLSIANNSEYDHNGNTRLTLTFNQSATPSESVVVCYKMDTPPIIDGQDKGIYDWGSEFEDAGSIVDLSNLRGSGNRITDAKVRAGYDDNYVYFLVSWVEPDQPPDYIASGDWTPDRWVYSWEYEYEVVGTTLVADSSLVWQQVIWKWEWLHYEYEVEGGDLITDSIEGWKQYNKNEDHLYLFWDINGVNGWDQSGSSLLYHDDDSLLYLDESGGLVDVWHWKAGRTGLVEYFDDEYVYGSGGVAADQGNPAFILNEENGMPKWMHRMGVENNGLPPLKLYDIVPFDENAGWEINARIPGYVSVVPTGGRADILCSESKLSWLAAQNRWTIEFKRARNTGSGDDVKF